MSDLDSIYIHNTSVDSILDTQFEKKIKIKNGKNFQIICSSRKRVIFLNKNYHYEKVWFDKYF